MNKKSREAIKSNLERALSPPASKRVSHLNGILDEYAPVEDLSPTPQAPPQGVSLPLEVVKPHTEDAPTLGVSLPLSVGLEAEVWQQVSPFKGYTKLYNAITDSLLPQLTTSQQAVYVHLFRLSYGFDKTSCVIALPTLARRAGMHPNGIQKVLKQLIERGLVEKVRFVLGKGKEQGVEYSLPIPSSITQSVSLPPSVSNKEHTLKETHTNTAGVRVSSRFSLKECRQYADSLKSEGIQNPGGYSTKIFRTGEADELVERFLNPPMPVVVDASQCPACAGSGWHYPKGPEKGIARCKHERLLATSS